MVSYIKHFTVRQIDKMSTKLLQIYNYVLLDSNTF